ncbi:acyl-CoA synthetase (AMP-forming)/AMP-acid ligase II [Glaciihabitans tibetensis]|uniref:Acyl-CoA synthetase (AMP-forming)/AMP-acid ligase II n=1 Tax=Glaciihabitans tibetensis TaxID=1266600 RepID=A0A2T0VG10_9MICO|nr:alpha/beta fold hydrolase [Glaciihabitans tibetensis]PRY69149.1 acyl-CoA synthetase (AMP-forming)/AMP-acid ligase II [Glaciihabitans tibetensis]
MSRLPRAASVAAEASHPPAGLPGLDPKFSRLVRAAVSERGGEADVSAPVTRTWHILDNGPELAKLGVETVGTVLCVHGNPTWSYLWRSLVSEATADAATGHPAWRIIAVDQLDMGFSERSGLVRALPQRVRDLSALTDALELDGPVLTFGHDWGGVVSLGWAVDHPELLAGVMLLNTAVHQSEAAPIPAPLRLALARGVLGNATVATPAFLETTLALAHPPLSSEVKNAYRAPYRTAARRGGIGGFVADIPVDAQHPSLGELHRIAAGVSALSVPALMLWGPRDPIFSDRYLDDLVERMPHADVHRFEGAGHLIAEDVDFASAALTWLGDRQGATSTSPNPDSAGHGSVALRAPLWQNLDVMRDSDDVALVEMVPSSGDGPRVVSWKLLSRRVRQIASGLSKAGVKKGDRVSLLIQPGADLTAVLYACLRIGAIVVVADAGLGLRGLTRAVRGAWPAHVIGAAPGLMAARALGWPGQKISTVRFPAATARALDVQHSLADLIELGADEVLPEAPRPDDTAAVLFTSGSTGPAKGVVYTHDQLSAVAEALSSKYGIGVGTGLVAGFAPFALLGPALGARSVTPDMVVTSPKTLTATAVAQAVAAVDATVLFLSPAAVTNVVATAPELSAPDYVALRSVTSFLSAGAPVSEPLLTAIATLMPNATPHTPYGMTEGLLMTDITLAEIREATASAPEGSAGGVCVGTPAATARVRISALDVNGDAVGEPSDTPGITGEIIVSAPHVKDHYDRLWLTDRASKREVASTGAGERWHRTGDVGHLDSAGRLWIEGRMPHVLVTANGIVTPVGPEQRIETVAAIARAAVAGVGPRGNQQVVAVVETVRSARRVGLASPELASAVRAATSVPIAAVLVVPHLPTDIRHNSKIDRVRLSTWAAGILSGGRMTRP